MSAGAAITPEDLARAIAHHAADRKALEIDPHLENIPEVVKTLSEKVEGRPI